MNKIDIARKIASNLCLYNGTVEAVLSGFVDEILGAISNGESVKISGLGTFTLVKRAPRVGNVPSRGERVEIPAKTAVVFKPSIELKRRAERNDENDKS